MDIINKGLISTDPLEIQTADIAKEIIESDNPDKVKDLTGLFNLTQVKKNVLRVLKLNGLLDKVSDEMVERFEAFPGAFTNVELLNYLQVVQNSIEKANKGVTQVDTTTPINMQQNNVTINMVDGLDKDSRDRVLDAVRAILNNARVSDDIESIDNQGDNECLINNG